MNERLTTFQVSCFLNKEKPVHTKLDNYEDDYFSLKPMQITCCLLQSLTAVLWPAGLNAQAL